MIVGEFGQIADALTRDGFAHVGAEQISIPAAGIDETKQDVHRRRLPCPVRSEETENLSWMNRQREVFHRLPVRLPSTTSAVRDTEIPEVYDGRQTRFCPSERKLRRRRLSQFRFER